MRAVIVADGDEVGEREVGQRVGQLVEVDFHAHDVRIGRADRGYAECPVMTRFSTATVSYLNIWRVTPMLRRVKRLGCVFAVICGVAIGAPPSAAAESLPVAAHIVIVIEENKP